MRPSDDANSNPDSPPESTGITESESTGLPWLRTWAGVYLLVIGCFVVCVALLVALTKIFS